MDACQPGADLGLLVCRVIIEDDVDGLVCGHLSFDGVQEANELLMPMSLHVSADDGAIQDIECGKQGRGPVALVIMRHGRASAALQRRARLGAIQGLDLALLIHGQHDGVGRRRDVKPDDIAKLLGVSMGTELSAHVGSPAISVQISNP